MNPRTAERATDTPSLRPAPDAIDVLIIDDDPAIQSVLTQALARHGYSSRCAADGRQALELLARHRFGMAITDILMPQLDGFELLMKCAAVHPGIPILAMSGGGGPGGPDDMLRPARLLGSRATLAKPFELTEVIAHVRRMLPRRAT